MSRKSEYVKKWRIETKKRMIASMGGQCVCCGYKKCDEGLEFHHRIPLHKDFSLSSVRSSPKSWNKVIEELRKCVLVCCRCHREIHAGVVKLPDAFAAFDESFVQYTEPKPELLDSCPQCGELKPKQNIYCSLVCVGKARRRIDWDDPTLRDMLSEMPIVKVAEILGVSDMAVRKRLKKIKTESKMEYGHYYNIEMQSGEVYEKHILLDAGDGKIKVRGQGYDQKAIYLSIDAIKGQPQLADLFFDEAIQELKKYV